MNSVRYRGYYYDQETGLYYVGSRYYDPEVGRFMNADDPSVIDGDAQYLSNNLYLYCFNNPVNMIDEDGNWPSWATKKIIGTAVIAAAAVLTVATAGTGSALACFAIGAAVGATNGAALGAINHRIIYRVMGWSRKGSNRWPGEYVWACDPDIEKTKICRVKEVYLNETLELIKVKIEGQDEIRCTNEHPFYSPVIGWTEAYKLRASDRLQLVNGEYVIVEQIQHEILEIPITVYNFSVEDYHTYFVGEESVLVYNPGRSGKQTRLREMANDDKLSSALRGEIKRDLNAINKGKRKIIRVPSGYEMAHRLGYSAKNGYSYKYAELNMRSLHRLQHRIMGYKY